MREKPSGPGQDNWAGDRSSRLVEVLMTDRGDSNRLEFGDGLTIEIVNAGLGHRTIRVDRDGLRLLTVGIHAADSCTLIEAYVEGKPETSGRFLIRR